MFGVYVRTLCCLAGRLCFVTLAVDCSAMSSVWWTRGWNWVKSLAVEDSRSVLMYNMLETLLVWKWTQWNFVSALLTTRSRRSQQLRHLCQRCSLPLYDFKKLHTWKNWQSAAASAAGMWRGENLVSLAWLVLQGIAAGKPNLAYIHCKRSYCVLSENPRVLFFVSWRSPLLPQNNWVSGIEFDDTSCIVFWDIVLINRQVKGKGFPYSLPSVGPRADPGVQAVSPQVTISHPLSSRLPLLSARPAVTFPAAQHHRPLADTKLYCLLTEAHRCEQLAQGCYAALAWSRIWTHELLITSPTLYPLCTTPP